MPDSDRPMAEPLVLTIGATAEALCRKAGCQHVQDATHPEHLLDRHGKVRSELDFFGRYVILISPGGESLRDRIAIALGDERCRWAYLPADPQDIRNAIITAGPMWTDEVSTIDDIPEPGPEVTYKSGFLELDEHGFRITLPAFMPIIGPYGSGKSVLLRQLLMNLWRLHKWKFLLTSFEEKVKPRYLRDLRRHIIRKPYVDLNGVVQWSDVEITRADAEINLGVARATARAVLDALEPADANAFQASFDALPDAVRTQAFRHMALDAGTSKPASDEQLRKFAALGEDAAALLKAWGSRGPAKLAAAYAKLDAMVEGVSDGDASATEAWIRGMSKAQRVAMMRALAG